MGNVVLRDRKQLSQDGIFIITLTIDKASGTVVAGPDVVSRGFVYVKESEKLMDDAREKIKEVLAKADSEKSKDWANIKSSIRDTLSRFLYEKTKRKPMIIPIISEI